MNNIFILKSFQKTESSKIYQSGTSLLETLIALLILSLGFLGFAKAELIGMRANQISYFQTLATIRIMNIAEQLNVCRHLDTFSECMAHELTDWQKENAALLPNAKSKAIASGNGYWINIRWKIIPYAKNGLSSDSLQQFISI